MTGQAAAVFALACPLGGLLLGVVLRAAGLGR